MKYTRIISVLAITTLYLLSGCSSISMVSQIAEALPEDAIGTATPAPTATPAAIDEAVNNIAVSSGIDQIEFLGLTGEDWTNLAISILMVILGSILSRLFVHYGLSIVRKQIKTSLWDEFISTTVATASKWLLLIFIIEYATDRLTFIDVQTKTLLSNIYFSITIFILAYIAWNLTNFLEYLYREKVKETNENGPIDPILTVLKRILFFFITIISFSFLLSRFGLNTNALNITLGIVGIALVFAAQDTLADTISGFTILADRPFRVNDTIEVEAVRDWGTVKEIGLRTTRILTYDNRMVIIPNSLIGKNQVVNYTYPTPHYRMETKLDIPYGTDIEKVRQIIKKTIAPIDGILADSVVEVLCHEMGESAIVMRVWWWINNYDDTPFIRGEVLESIERTLLENGIQLAYPTQNINLVNELKIAEQKHNDPKNTSPASPNT